jgi:hypothetical protein
MHIITLESCEDLGKPGISDDPSRLTGSLARRSALQVAVFVDPTLVVVNLNLLCFIKRNKTYCRYKERGSLPSTVP